MSESSNRLIDTYDYETQTLILRETLLKTSKELGVAEWAIAYFINKSSRSFYEYSGNKKKYVFKESDTSDLTSTKSEIQMEQSHELGKLFKIEKGVPYVDGRDDWKTIKTEVYLTFLKMEKDDSFPIPLSMFGEDCYEKDKSGKTVYGNQQLPKADHKKCRSASSALQRFVEEQILDHGLNREIKVAPFRDAARNITHIRVYCIR